MPKGPHYGKVANAASVKVSAKHSTTDAKSMRLALADLLLEPIVKPMIAADAAFIRETMTADDGDMHERIKQAADEACDDPDVVQALTEWSMLVEPGVAMGWWTNAAHTEADATSTPHGLATINYRIQLRDAMRTASDD